jgi:hypothetical protein
MADIANKYAENVSGEFYVRDGNDLAPKTRTRKVIKLSTRC